MKSKLYKSLSAVVILTMVLFTACIKDLDTVPLDDDVITSGTVYQSFDNYEKVLAKCYAGLVLTGQRGPDGDGDIRGIDEGFSQYMRGFWYIQELTTDEAIIGWNDGNLRDYQEMDWSAANEFIRGMYYRIFYQIALCNEFIGQTTESKVSDRGFTTEQVEAIAQYRAEARFLRALSYYHAIDMFGYVPFVTEEDGVGSYLPEQISRTDLFDYVEAELLAIESILPDPQEGEYGRADKAAVWMLLAKMYLNAEVYGAGDHYDDVITWTERVITEGGYELEDTYAHMFMADNHTADGIIFATPYDGLQTQTWGGTTFLVNAQVGGTMSPANFGISGGWWGIRAKPQFVAKFPADNSDTRKMFYTSGQNLEIANMFDFTNGYAVTKWTNKTSTGTNGKNSTHPDTDFPVFRLADAHLMYAEAFLRGGNGTQTNALNYVNAIREKAYGNTSGNITGTDLTLDFILDERARELYWEGHRRTDLIRYGLFTGGDYLWAWKGGVQAGIATDDKYNLLPIPDADRSANPNLDQNDGY